jgi:hypothetical protein
MQVPDCFTALELARNPYGSYTACAVPNWLTWTVFRSSVGLSCPLTIVRTLEPHDRLGIHREGPFVAGITDRPLTSFMSQQSLVDAAPAGYCI